MPRKTQPPGLLTPSVQGQAAATEWLVLLHYDVDCTSCGPLPLHAHIFRCCQRTPQRGSRRGTTIFVTIFAFHSPFLARVAPFGPSLRLLIPHVDFPTDCCSRMWPSILCSPLSYLFTPLHCPCSCWSLPLTLSSSRAFLSFGRAMSLQGEPSQDPGNIILALLPRPF